MGEPIMSGCPCPVTVALERLTIKSRFQHAYRIRDGAPPPLDEWLTDDHARQMMEAGHKEVNGPFFVQPQDDPSAVGMP